MQKGALCRALPWACQTNKMFWEDSALLPLGLSSVERPYQKLVLCLGAAQFPLGDRGSWVCATDKPFLFQESISDRRGSTSSCLTTSSGSGNTIRYKIKSSWVAKIAIKSLRKNWFLHETVSIPCVLVNILEAATLWGRKGFAYVFNRNNFHYSLSCKIAIPGVSAAKSHSFWSRLLFWCVAALCSDLVLDTPRENSDVLPAALRNLSPYFSWISPSRVEFIFHLQAEIFLLRKEEKLFHSLILLKEL